MKSDARFRASYYNLRVSDPPRTLLFNGVTGALLKLDRKLARALAPWLGEERPRTAGTGYAAWQSPEFRVAELPASVRDRFPALLDAGVFVPRDADEREGLRHAYVENRSIAPFFVTITTTLDCNMRCYYCYQKEGELEKMSPAMADAIASWIEREVVEREHSSAHLDWYGGEPMLNPDVIERISARIIPFCAANGVAYKGSMICNGTNWPADKAVNAASMSATITARTPRSAPMARSRRLLQVRPKDPRRSLPTVGTASTPSRMPAAASASIFPFAWAAARRRRSRRTPRRCVPSPSSGRTTSTASSASITSRRDGRISARPRESGDPVLLRVKENAGFPLSRE